MKLILKILIIWLLGQIQIITLSAQQNPQPYFRNYSTEHGFPSPEVYCVLEDSEGYMWFGTDNGVARFDGYEFKTFGAQEGLWNNVVFEIQEDTHGRIWFGTMFGELFIYEDNKIIPYTYNDVLLKHNKGKANSYLKTIDKEENVWVEIDNLGVLKIDNFGDDTVYSSKLPITFFLKKQNNLPAFFAFVTNGNASDYEKYYQESVLKQNYLEVCIDTTCKEYVLPFLKNVSGGYGGTMLSTGHILLLNHGTLSCIYDEKIIWQIPFNGNTIEIIEDKKGTIWFCREKGLRKYSTIQDLEKGVFEHYLPNRFVSNFRIDSKNGIWVTTIDSGIFYCNNSSVLNYNNRFGLSNDFVNSVAFKNNSELFARCKNGDIFLIDVNQNKILKKYKPPLDFGENDLFYDRARDIIWTGSFYWKESRWITPVVWNTILKKIIKVQSKTLKNLQLNKDGNLVGGRRNGLYFFNLKKDSAIHVYSESRIEGMLVSKQSKKLWIGTSEGLFEFKDNKFHSPNIKHPLFNHRVEAIDELMDSTLVFGTKGYGVILWKDNQLTQLTDENGLVSNMIEDIHVDHNNTIWIGTLNGLNKVSFNSMEDIKVRQFTMTTGLPSNEVYQIKSQKDQLWLCTGGGLVKFQEHPENRIAPKPILQEIKVNQKALITPLKTLFTYTENSFSFNFLGINYNMFGQVPYRYRLYKADNWQYTKNLTVNYPTLMAGDYEFEVQAQNEDGYWSESTYYDFSILPPWWQTNWAKILFSFCFLTIVVKGNQIYHAHKLQRALDKKLAQEVERDRIASDLHDGMGTEISKIKMKLEQLLRKTGLLEEETNFGFILRRIGGLHKQLQDIIWVTNTEYDNLESLIIRMQEEAYSFLEESPLQCNFSIDKKFPYKKVSGLFRQNLIYAFQEILNNTYKHAKASKVDIRIQFKKKYLSLIIKDDGIGFNPNDAPKGTGKGIPNIKKRIKDIGGTIQFDSAHGTIITILIPYEKS